MGQTLAEWMKKDPTDKSAASADDPSLRLFVAEKVGSPTPLDNVRASMPWTRCNPTSVLDSLRPRLLLRPQHPRRRARPHRHHRRQLG